ncbi:hypothetical protein L3Q82_006378 [Scortum barcoo]|uniref:Uncharacterized protein n=1 Tax=Scortum barcoo TaxID=214431 RepID=A0ACB8WZS2_9TELE|nr:hypothetical protein L3Q82_006378 [Scortum barcoo]
MRFSSHGRGTLDQLYTLRRVLEGLWEFAQPVHMCFVDLEKAFDRVPRGILWGVLREYGVRGPLLRAVRSLYDRSRSLVRIAGSKSDLFPVHVGLRQGCPLSPVLFIIFMDRISRRSQGPEGVRFGNHRISSLLFADDVVVLPREVFQACPTGRRPWGRPRTHCWRDYVSRLAWERLGVPLEELEEVSGLI